MFEIYYTSAPEGLKPNTRGFCTVAATEGMPRVLGERLESLSGYRHHFAAGDATGGRNPISYAHWLLVYGGSQYHVLSRVCDSGMDYTRRTNAFAHHIALDNAEAAAEGAGPAALIGTAGILQTTWDQRVGALQRTQLPRLGSFGEARVCAQWQRIAGDAGWAGVLAESFTKNPPRPVCLLFSPGQEMLPLLAEAIALLPPAQRWQVTFNTYFTSMPPSATCVWRCCLAGTPAADGAVRYAAGGLVLDLSQRGKLPAIVESPWVEYARTGVMPPGGLTNSGGRTPERKGADGVGSMAMPGASSPKVSPAVSKELARGGSETGGGTINIVPAEEGFEEERIAVNRDGSAGRRLTPGLMMTEAEESPASPREIVSGSGRGIMVTVMVIVLVIVIFSIYLLIRALIPPLPPPVVTDHALPVAVGDHSGEGPVVVPVSPPVQSAASAPAPLIAVPIQPLVTAATPPAENPNAGPELVPAAFSRDLTLKPLLKNPIQPPMSINDKVQKLRIDARRVSGLDQITGLQLLLGPDEKSSISYKDQELEGVFTQEFDASSGKPGVALFWKNPLDPAEPSEVASIHLLHARSEVEVVWKARMLADIEHARAAVVAFWILQNATLVTIGSPQGKPLHLHFEPMSMAKLTLAEEKVKLEPAIDLPAGATPRVVGGLPAGWRADVVVEPEKDSPGVSQVLYIAQSGGDKSAAGDLRGWFTLRFKPGWSDVESTLARNRDENERKLADALQAVKELDASMNQKIADADSSIQGMAKVVKESRINQLDAEMAEPKKQKADLQKTVDACMLVRHDFDQIKFLDVAIDLPGNLPAVKLHFFNPLATSIKE